MKLREYADLQLVTTGNPVRSGRNPSFYPILVLSDKRKDCKADIIKLYPASCFIQEPMDRYYHPIPGICDVMQGKQRLARYRLHEDHGWLEELSPVWAVKGDYSTVLAVTQIADLEAQGDMNIATVMRFGAQLAALLMGNSDKHIRSDVLALLRKITLRIPSIASRVEIEGDAIKLTL